MLRDRDTATPLRRTHAYAHTRTRVRSGVPFPWSRTDPHTPPPPTHSPTHPTPSNTRDNAVRGPVTVGSRSCVVEGGEGPVSRFAAEELIIIIIIMRTDPQLPPSQIEPEPPGLPTSAR
eukprot:7380406-Prymnesium_polylepis.2